jgi:phosphatidylglycerophosphate synthase
MNTQAASTVLRDRGHCLAGLGMLLALALTLAAVPVPGFLGWPTLVALALYAAVAWRVLRGYPPHRHFGLANTITAARAAAAAFIFGLAVAAPTGGLALLSDGLDGWVARRGNTVSAFGARFDMEADALLTLDITFALLAAGRVGGWVLAIGLGRYMFVAGGRLGPVLARPLPPSRRRKAVSAGTIVALLAAAVPATRAATAGVICAAGLMALAASFGMDCIWLVRMTGTDPAFRPATGTA